MSAAEFRSYFERFGRVMSAEVMFNRETHKSRGFGFIVFELERGAEQVCSEREHIIDGKVVSTTVRAVVSPFNILNDFKTFTISSVYCLPLFGASAALHRKFNESDILIPSVFVLGGSQESYSKI